MHLDDPSPHIVVRAGKGGGPTKSGQVRTVPVLPMLVPILRAHVATLASDATLVFPNPDGERYNEDYDFRIRFTSAVLAA